VNKYEAKQQARRDRLEARADRARSASNMTYTRAEVMASAIPFGQPILRGHHSERRDRNYRARIHNTFGKAFALQDQAKELERRAAAVGKGGISSDDPEAVDKLRVKLAELEERHDRMKSANALIRREDRTGLAALGYTADAIEKLFRPDYRGRAGFASYELTNSSANIRRIRDRIAALEKIAERCDREEQGQGYTYREDVEDNRAAFVFDAKPDKPVRDLMKRNGFVFSPSRSFDGKSAWVRKLTPAAINTARWLRPQLDQMRVNE
jgi:vacuolar-type H+-ATPase subunit I/STV1